MCGGNVTIVYLIDDYTIEELIRLQIGASLFNAS